MLNQEDAQRMAMEWVKAWNKHDLNAIMSHYAADVEFTSPLIVKLMGNLTGKLIGRDALRAYFQKALSAYPTLHFELESVFCGVDSLVVHYRSVNNMTAAETMVLNAKGQAIKVMAHYMPSSGEPPADPATPATLPKWNQEDIGKGLDAVDEGNKAKEKD